MIIRDWCALKMIRLARLLTTWGDVDDMLCEAEHFQRRALETQVAGLNASEE